MKKSPEDVMPWKVLGQKWHLARKGFPPGKKPAWAIEVLEDLLEILSEEAPAGQFLWNNQEVVHLMLPEQREPWASIYTKRLAAVDLVLNGPQNAFALGRIVEIGSERSLLNNGDHLDRIKFRFITAEDLDLGDMADFLKEHLEIVRGAVVPQST